MRTLLAAPFCAAAALAVAGSGAPQPADPAGGADPLPGIEALAIAHNTAGLEHWRAARYDSAVHYLSRSRDLWSQLGDAAWLGRVYNNLGAAHYQWGNYEPALDAFLRSVSLRRESGDRRGQALALTNVGLTYHDWQQHERARAAFEEALAIGRELGDSFAQGYASHHMGGLELTLGNFAAARAWFEASLAHYGSRPGQDAMSGWSLNQLMLGLTYIRQGDPDMAIPVLEQVLETALAGDHPRGEARALVYLGHAHRARGDVDRAVSMLERAVTVASGTGQRTLALEALAALATALEARGDHRAALARFRTHEALRDSIFSQAAAQRIAAMEARAEADRQERENARLREDGRVREAVIARQRAVVALGAALLAMALVLVGALVHFNRAEQRRRQLLARANTDLQDTNRQLSAALSEVRTLKGLIPICVHCKKVRDDHGFWEAVESYITSRSDALFSHGICTDCGPRVYGDDWAHGGEPVSPPRPASGGAGQPPGRRSASNVDI